MQTVLLKLHLICPLVLTDEHGEKNATDLKAKAINSPGRRISPKPMMLYPPHGSNIRGIFNSMGTPSSSVLSPRATCKQTTSIARCLADNKRKN